MATKVITSWSPGRRHLSPWFGTAAGPAAADAVAAAAAPFMSPGCLRRASMVDYMAETAAVMLAWTGSRSAVDDIAVPMAVFPA